MAVFYVLPPRAILKQWWTEIMQNQLPGLPCAADAWLEMIEQQVLVDNYVVFRDDLPPDEPLGASLRHAFGAEATDQVVEIGLTTPTARPRVREQLLADIDSALAAASSV